MDKSSEPGARSHSIGGSKLEVKQAILQAEDRHNWTGVEVSPQARKGLEPAKVVHAQRS